MPRLLPAEGASLGHRCVPQALLPTPEQPAEMENVLFQLPDSFFIPLYYSKPDLGISLASFLKPVGVFFA